MAIEITSADSKGNAPVSPKDAADIVADIPKTTATDAEFTKSDEQANIEKARAETARVQSLTKEQYDAEQAAKRSPQSVDVAPLDPLLSRSENVSAILKTATTPVEQAARNVIGASQYNVTPEAYGKSQKVYEQQSELDKLPQRAPAVVAQRMAQSTQHASVIKKDLNAFDYLQKQVNFTVDTIKNRFDSRRLFNLQYEKMMGNPLSESDDSELYTLHRKLKSLTPTDMSFAETIPGETVSGVIDLAHGIWDNAKLFLGGVGAGAVGGAALGTIGAPATAGASIPIAAVTGALTAAPFAAEAAMVYDGFKQGSGEIYYTLTNNAFDKNANLDVPKTEAEMKTLALGGGALMGLLQVIPVNRLMKEVPWLQKLVSPRAVLSTALENPAWRRTLMSLGKSALAGGVAGGAQEAVNILTKSVGETWNGDEVSFQQGLQNAAANWKTNAVQIGKSTVSGAAVGAGAHVALHAAAPVMDTILTDKSSPKIRAENQPAPEVKPAKPSKDQPLPIPPKQEVKVTDLTSPNNNLPAVVRGTKAAQLKIALERASQVTKNTETGKHLPSELDTIRQGMFEDAGMDSVYVDKEDLTRWANDDKKAKAARSILDSSGTAAAEVDAPIRVDMNKFLKLVDEHPDAAGIAKTDPENPSAQKWLERMNEAEVTRAKLEAEKPAGTSPEGPGTEPRLRDEDIFNERGYLEQPTFTEKMKDVLPEKEIAKYNDAQKAVRTEVVDAIKADSDKHMDQIVDLETRTNMLHEREFQTAEAERDQNIQVVEDFLQNTKAVGELTKQQQLQKLAGRPIYAINPESLPERLRVQYENNETIVRRKVLDPKGVDVREAMAVFGVESPSALMQILSDSPTRREAVNNAVVSRAAEVESETRNNTEFDESRLAKAYNNMTKNHIKEMAVLRDKYWAATKSGIKRVALELPKINDLIVRAKDAVGSTRVKDLNPNQWKVAERRSQRKAVDAILRNETESAFREKENAAYSSQLTKETHVAIGKVNKALDFVANLNSPRNQTTLRDAGKLYSDAINSILDAYNFDPSKKGIAENDSYNKFVKKMLEQGRGDFSIPADVAQWLSPGKSAKELTVDQLLYLTDKMQSIMKQARMKNKLVGKYTEAGLQLTKEIIAADLHEEAVKHPDYDPKRASTPQGDVPKGFRFSNLVNTLESFVVNIKSMTEHLD